MISRLLLLVFVVAAAACDKVPLTAPTNSTITISAASRSVGLGGSTEVSAFVAENSGTPVQNGTSVRFTTNLGRVDPVEAQTRNGVAVTTFFAGDTSGTAQIRATSGGTAGTANTVDVAVGAVAATTVVMSAQPNTLPVGGGTSTIVASVLDGAGNRLRGVPVSFSTDVGTLSSSSAVTDSNGDATVQLTTSRQAVVTARAGGGGGSGITASVTVRVVTANAVVLTVPTAAVQVGQAVTVTVAPPADANATVPNVTLSWGDGTVDNLGALPASRTVSHIYNSAGTFQIIATATADGASVSTSAAVTVNPKPAVGVTVAASVAAATINVTPVTFTATVSGNDASTVVTSYRWQFVSAAGVIEFETTTSGNAITRVFTSIGVKTANVTVTFSDGRTATAQTQIVVN
jgi:adhesin/invasin